MQAIRALQEQLREQAIRDPLTGFYNRLQLNEFFDRELGLAERSQKPLSIVLGDIDHFKRVNDTFGHLAGDAVLKQFSNQLHTTFRATDISCRYGGEEFLILLPDTDLETAAERAEQMRAAIADNPVPYGMFTVPITASFGVSFYPRDGRGRTELIAAADRALYAAKQAGRNRVKRADAVRKPGF